MHRGKPNANFDFSVTPIFDSLTLFFDHEPRSAALNMAIDEELLRTAKTPVLRVYRWANKAVSFGYFEKAEAVRGLYPDREIVRRWTGGGVVPHGSDLTYSLIVKSDERFMKLDAGESYRVLHGALAETLRSSGFSAELAKSRSEKTSSACFENPVLADIVLEGRKIAGAAQRRTRDGLLHQGSVQLSGVPDNFAAEFASRLATSIGVLKPSLEFFQQAHRLAIAKYASAEWTRRT